MTSYCKPRQSRMARFAACALLLATSIGTTVALAQERSISLALGRTYRAPAVPARHVDNFHLEVEKTGLLTLDLSDPYLIAVDPAIEVVASKPGSKLLWIEGPRSLEISVSTGIPGQDLAAYKLRTAFVARTAPAMQDLVLFEDPPNTCAVTPTSLGLPFELSEGVLAANAVDQWDCDVLEGQNLTGGVLRLESRLGVLQTSLFGSSACASDTLLGAGTLWGITQILAPVFPGPFRIAVESAAGFVGNYILGAALLDPCHQGELDDHPETWLCATPLATGKTVDGWIANAHGDDVDLFTVSLGTAGQVFFDLGSSADGWRLRVSDAAGQPVAGPALAGSWQGPLAAGRYFLAVDRPNGSSAASHLNWSSFP